MEAYSFKSPGRINLLGEHTDYNGGTVLPACIEQGITFNISANNLNHFLAHSQNKNQQCILSKENTILYPWTRYWWSVLQHCPYPIKDKGWTFAIHSDLPIGAGLSSSSALTCGMIHGLNHIFQWNLPVEKLIEWAVFSENGTGVNGGAMDQSVIFSGKKDHILELNCRTGSHQFHQWLGNLGELFLINSNSPHSLIDSEYNQRRAVCDRARYLWNQHQKPIDHLTQLSKAELPFFTHLLTNIEFQMIEYVVEEEERVATLLESIPSADLSTIGNLLNETHRGLSQKFKVSTAYMDYLQSNIQCHPHVYGARMMGGGFGGSILVLADENQASSIFEEVSEKVKDLDHQPIEFLPVSLTDGLINRTVS